MKERMLHTSRVANIEPDPQLWLSGEPELYSLDLAKTESPSKLIDTREMSLWRYRSVLPFEDGFDGWRDVTLGEGATPLVCGGREYGSLKFKVEYAMPTLSFKDRGAAVFFAKAVEWGVKSVVADSSGNAGTAIAAFAARTGIQCDVFVPAYVSTGKLAQMRSHGANVHLVDGPRSAATDAAKAFARSHRRFYASHVYNPYFFEGTKTMAYEIWEQLGFKTPGHLVLPVGHGTMFLGAYIGFKEIFDSGLSQSMPKIHAVQAAACAPIVTAFDSGSDHVDRFDDSPTCAEGISINSPPRGAQILEALHSTSGSGIRVTDDEILAAKKELSGFGYYVETTAAAAFAAYLKARKSLEVDGGTVIVPLCGSGLKSPDY